MKKLSALFISMLIASSAQAADITVVNPSNKASPATVFATMVKDSLGQDTKFYQSQTCEDAQKTFASTKDSVLVYNSSIDFAGRNKNLSCPFPDTKTGKIIFIGREHMNICTARGSATAFTEGKITMGMASMYSTRAHEANFKSAGVNMTLVPYAGSKDILNAVLNHDIAFGFLGYSIASRSKDIECIYSTNPEDSNYIGKSLRLAVPDFRITLMLYTNSNDPSVLKSLQELAKNEGFNRYLETSGMRAQWNPSAQDVEDVRRFVDGLVKNWADR